MAVQSGVCELRSPPGLADWLMSASQPPSTTVRPTPRARRSHASGGPMASQSRNNVRKRGNTWTYYVYVTDGTGKRNQVSKGGFRTRKETEAARV